MPDGAALPHAGAELSTRILGCPLNFLHDHFGEQSVESTLREAGGDPTHFAPPYAWISHALFERVLEGIRSRVSTDREFMEACAYRHAESYGPFTLLLRMSTIKQVYRLFASTSHVVTKISRFAIEDMGRGHVRFHYTSTRPESRLMCLSRQAQNRSVPGMWWSVPTPTIEEHRCIAWGDRECCYDLRWKEPLRWGLAAGGLTAGALVGIASVMLGASPWIVALFAALGLAAAWLLESRRVVRENQRAALDTNAALLTLTESHQQATAELIDLHRRQQIWNEEVESLVAARTEALETIVNQLQGLRMAQDTRVRSLSHDIRNPLCVLRTSTSFLREELEEAPEPITEALSDLDDATRRTELLLEDLAQAATVTHATEPSRVETMSVAFLGETIRGRLKALVLGRDIRSMVSQTREVPASIRTDAILLDRVLDNLLTNAAKYTDRGSILVELDGTPGHLCIRISDTGRGISAERLDTVFSGTEPDQEPRVGSSLGLGLSVVVRTLAQLAGRVEVMSRPDQGTTFWLYVPVETASGDPESGGEANDEPVDEIVRRVIRIREQK